MEAALRTAYEVGGDGGFAQRVRPTPSGLALMAEAFASDESSAGSLASSEASRGFELLGEDARVLRCTLVRAGAAGSERWLLLLTVHHVAYDGASGGVLHGELGALYGSLRVGGLTTDAGLAPMRLQYVDFAVWQREALSGVLESDAKDGASSERDLRI